RLLKARKEEKPITNVTLRKVDAALGRMLDSLDEFYQRVLNWALDHRKTTVLIAAGIFVGSLLLLPVVGTEFMPKSDEGQMTVSIELQSGTRLEETIDVVQKIENIIKKK
ncbi:TPA: efflux RND transporter permease subunit, partial [bacterium]|nr:efflux RND transporter permease subunit [bacterium]